MNRRLTEEERKRRIYSKSDVGINGTPLFIGTAGDIEDDAQIILQKCLLSSKTTKIDSEEVKGIKDPDTFIRALQVSYLDNTEVKIQYKGKRKNYTCESIGFRDGNTKAWKTFLEILQNKDHVYNLGPAHLYDKGIHKKIRNKEYENRLNLLKQINKKLKSFLTKQYNIKFPPDFKLYEPQPTKGPGVYSFKFQIPSDKPSYKTKNQALRHLKKLFSDGISNDAVQSAVETAMEAGASQDEVSKIVKDLVLSQPEYDATKDEPDSDDENKEVD